MPSFFSLSQQLFEFLRNRDGGNRRLVPQFVDGRTTKVLMMIDAGRENLLCRGSLRGRSGPCHNKGGCRTKNRKQNDAAVDVHRFSPVLVPITTDWEA